MKGAGEEKGTFKKANRPAANRLGSTSEQSATPRVTFWFLEIGIPFPLDGASARQTG
jgi:hypothetical protein